MKVCCVIPAKGNSRRLPGKNMMPVGGVPMTVRAVQGALDSARVEYVAVSSNDADILAAARDAGAHALERGENLCGDDVRAKDVVHAHLLELGERFDAVAMLMPTTPFRTATHVREAVDAFSASGLQALVSVCEYEFSPALAMTVEDGRVGQYFDHAPGWVREDAFPTGYHLNGAIYLAEYDFFMRERTFMAEDTAAYVMDRMASLDVDTPEDYRLAELYCKMMESELA